MRDLLWVIYEHLLDRLDLTDPEYQENLRYAAEQREALLRTLTPEQAARLRDYQGMTDLASSLREEAIFRSAFRAGLYLGNISRP